MTIMTLLCLVAIGCQSVGFYAQAVKGHVGLMRARIPVDDLLADPDTDPALVLKLTTTREILAFADRHVLLPVEGRYRTFVDLGRSHVVWNVFATEEFSVEPMMSCFPVVGCASYRGFFDRRAAERAATRLRRAAHDVRVSGTAAYSTLGWFDDPLLSSFIHWQTPSLAGLLMHELAHSRVFAPGDTEFNESYASFVERQAVAEWLTARDDAHFLQVFEEQSRRADRLTRFMLDAREALDRLYAAPYPEFARRVLKTVLLARTSECYSAHRVALGEDGERGDVRTAFDNADFLPWAAYQGWVPAFRALFDGVDRQWGRFHEAAAALAKLDGDARQERLVTLTGLAPRHEGATDAPIRCESLEPVDR